MWGNRLGPLNSGGGGSAKSQEGLEPRMAPSITAVAVILCDGEAQSILASGTGLYLLQGLKTRMFAGKLLLVLLPIKNMRELREGTSRLPWCDEAPQ